MKQSPNEAAIEYMRRVVNVFNHEEEGVLYELPCVGAVLEFAHLWDKYDTEFLAGIYSAIEAGADPAPLRKFITKHKLTWEVPQRGTTTDA